MLLLNLSADKSIWTWKDLVLVFTSLRVVDLYLGSFVSKFFLRSTSKHIYKCVNNIRRTADRLSYRRGVDPWHRSVTSRAAE